MSDTKTCTRCDTEKPKSEFSKRQMSKRDGLRPECKACYREYQGEYRKANKDKIAEYACKSRYGLTLEDKRAMWRSQDGLCLICRAHMATSKATHIDHDHRTNKIRGLLCSACNTGLGLFRDNPEILQSAIEYLKT